MNLLIHMFIELGPFWSARKSNQLLALGAATTCYQKNVLMLLILILVFQ